MTSRFKTITFVTSGITRLSSDLTKRLIELNYTPSGDSRFTRDDGRYVSLELGEGVCYYGSIVDRMGIKTLKAVGDGIPYSRVVDEEGLQFMVRSHGLVPKPR